MGKRFWIASAVGLLLVLMSAIGVVAMVDTAVDWWALAGGSAPTSGDGITMKGTLGLPVIGQSSGTDVSLGAGYWAAGGEYAVFLPLVMRNYSP